MNLSNLIAAISAIIAIFAIFISMSASKENDRVDIENRITAVEESNLTKADLSGISAISESVNSIKDDIEELRRTLEKKADVADVPTKEDIARTESRLDTALATKSTTDSISSRIEPIVNDISGLKLRLDQIVSSTTQQNSSLQSTLSGKTSGISYSNPSATGIQGDLNASNNKWGGESAKESAFLSAEYCPEGYYVVGMRGLDTDGGGYCSSCISGIEFVCRAL